VPAEERAEFKTKNSEKIVKSTQWRVVRSRGIKSEGILSREGMLERVKSVKEV
jgi:hypothetical protein